MSLVASILKWYCCLNLFNYALINSQGFFLYRIILAVFKLLHSFENVREGENKLKSQMGD